MCKIPPNIIAEAVELIGEGEYNLNSLKEIKITDSYLGLDQEDRGCQNVEPYENCTTRQYLRTILEECGCLPLNIRLFNEVLLSFIYKSKQEINPFISFRNHFALLHKSWTV